MSMHTSIWMVRHGQTELNRARRYQGALDSPITCSGRRQNDALASRLRGIPLTAAMASPCNRARTTANSILEQRKPRLPVLEDRHWHEMHQGLWEGLTYDEVQERFPQEAQTRFADALHGRAPGGESLAEVAARVKEGWRTLQCEYIGERILLATHALPIQIVLCTISGMPLDLYWRWRIDLGSVTGISIYSGSPIIRMVNEVPPL